jgi:outer membrane protein OmpA-like peptidoglycan-associated protein
MLNDASTVLMGSAQPDAVEGMLGDGEFVEFGGNVAFFTGQGTTRNFDVLQKEIQQSFIQLKLITGTTPVEQAGWDYAKLAVGLTHADLNVVPRQNFDTQKAQDAVQKQIASGTGEDGTLYQFEIFFQPSQSDFPASQYADAFKKVVELSQTFGGAIVTIEGHADPSWLYEAEHSTSYWMESSRQKDVKERRDWLQDLSDKRSAEVRRSYMAFAKGLGLKLDESQLMAVGMGATHPIVANPQSNDEHAHERRVVFRLKSVETEPDSFQPN